MMIQKIKQIENIQIPVKDLEESVNWYQNVLGFKEVGRENKDLAFLALESGNHINLWRTGDHSTINFTRNGEEMAAFVMVTEDIEHLKKELEHNDVDILWYSNEGFATGMKFKDPTGNLMLVLEYKK
ncbi:VOC family protein [Paenibacillus mesophilus]|uniref:VOC family protein n=1 Tax=Paenibacillus mesophilus TaxID=2582849 RepID=UPI00110F5638|nr:VOC family protein [Paenibacillus mesophilus]TMV50326.1 VOC family protein [Paenibacillus mesophilus]